MDMQIAALQAMTHTQLYLYEEHEEHEEQYAWIIEKERMRIFQNALMTSRYYNEWYQYNNKNTYNILPTN